MRRIAAHGILRKSNHCTGRLFSAGPTSQRPAYGSPKPRRSPSCREDAVGLGRAGTHSHCLAAHDCGENWGRRGRLRGGGWGHASAANAGLGGGADAGRCGDSTRRLRGRRRGRCGSVSRPRLWRGRGRRQRGRARYRRSRSRTGRVAPALPREGVKQGVAFHEGHGAQGHRLPLHYFHLQGGGACHGGRQCDARDPSSKPR